MIMPTRNYIGNLPPAITATSQQELRSELQLKNL
jgi:hypothetical protein